MNIFMAWKESISLLYPKNLKPFLMVTAKTIIDIYRSMNKPMSSRGNWIAAIVLIFLIGFTNLIKIFHFFTIEAVLLNSIWGFLIFMFTLGMRASVDIKNKDYFLYYSKKYWYLGIVTLLLSISHIFIIPFSFIFYVLFLLFIFDSYGSASEFILALKNSIKMLIYNLPIFLLLFFVLRFVNLILYALVAFALGYFGGLTIATFFYILFMPIHIAFIANLYIKFIHSQSSLYFNQPE